VTVLATPLVTASTPLSTVADPSVVNVAVMVVLEPTVIVSFEVTKLVITGFGITVTVTDSVSVSPAALVTVRVYMVVTEGVSVLTCPLVTEIAPGLIVPVEAPVKVLVSVMLSVAVIDVAEGVNAVITGRGITVIVSC